MLLLPIPQHLESHGSRCKIGDAGVCVLTSEPVAIQPRAKTGWAAPEPKIPLCRAILIRSPITADLYPSLMRLYEIFIRSMVSS